MKLTLSDKVLNTIKTYPGRYGNYIIPTELEGASDEILANWAAALDRATQKGEIQLVPTLKGNPL